MRMRTREPRRRRFVQLETDLEAGVEARQLRTARAPSRVQAARGTRCVVVGAEEARQVCDLAAVEGQRVLISHSATRYA